MTASDRTDEVVRALRSHLTGEVVGAGDAEYDAARAVWNGMIDKRPVAIARVGDVDDVAVVVRAARRFGLPLAVRGGGHNVAGLATSEGGLVIDLSALNAVTVDPERRRATVQGGAIWRDVDAATQPYGLAAPAGLVSETGVAGLTLGGGLGWLRRKHGLSCDNLVAADLVTADGEACAPATAGAPGPAVGAARRWRQLRRGHVVRVPPASRRARGRAGARVLQGRADRRRPARLPRPRAVAAAGDRADRLHRLHGGG